jgi:diguanylate cyclase (GGDEF)-like protein
LAAAIARHLADLDRRRLVDQFNAIMNNVGLGIAFTDSTGQSTINHVAADLLGLPVGEGRAADLAIAMRERRDHCQIRASHGLDDSELTSEFEASAPVSGEYWIFPNQPGHATRVVRVETYNIGDSLNPGRVWVFNDVSALWDAAQRMKTVNAELQQNNIQLAEEIDKRTMVEAALRESEAEIRRYAEDLELTRSSIEQRAHEAVELAEELAIQKQELEESKRQSDYLANHDPLTGLFNRRAFRNHLQQTIEIAHSTRTQAAILFIDLDKFKAVNDTLGHDAGDQLLKKVAQILTETLRDTDLIARFGGDEFAIATRIPPHGGLERITGLAERIRQKLQIPMLAADGIIEICGTIGIATFPADAVDMDSLFIAADQAMYAGKKRGRNCVVMFKDLDDGARQ